MPKQYVELFVFALRAAYHICCPRLVIQMPQLYSFYAAGPAVYNC